MYWIGLRRGRRPLEHQLARLGQARLEQLLRAVERRGHRVRAEPARRFDATRAARRAGRARGSPRSAPRPRCGACWCGEDLAALAGAAARGGERRRAAQPRGDRAGAARLGPHHARRLRPDRDHGADRQPAGPAAQARLDGPAAARAIASRCWTTRARRRTKARSRSRSTRRPLGLMAGYLDDDGARIRGLAAAAGITPATSPRRDERGLHHLCRPRRRRVQELRLPHQPVRAGERADRAPGGGGGRGGARARPDAARRAEGVRRCSGPAPRPTAPTALAIFQFVRQRLAPYKRVRRIEFSDLPKTISGKIRRVELRRLEEERARTGERGAAEFREEEFPELRGTASARG